MSTERWRDTSIILKMEAPRLAALVKKPERSNCPAKRAGSSLKDKLIKVGAKVISHGRSIAIQMAGRHSPANVPGYFAADRGTPAEAAFASLKRPMVIRMDGLITSVE